MKQEAVEQLTNSLQALCGRVLDAFRVVVLCGAVLWLLAGCGATPPKTSPEASVDSATSAQQLAVGFNRAKLAYLSGEYEFARQAFLPLARAGHPEAQYVMGFMLFKGQGGEIEMEQAYAWFRLAAEQGNKKAFQAIARINQAREKLVNSPD